MSKKTIYYIIIILLSIGLIGAGDLVINEIKTGSGCPKLLHIPMCIIIFICFAIPLVVHLSKKRAVLYFIFTGIAGCIALAASIMQFMGNAQCPKTTSGTPMCYYSLFLFSSLLFLKMYHFKLNKKTIS